MHSRRPGRLAAVALLVLAFALVASPALAHVTANPSSAEPDGYFRTAFRVGHGCDGSPTTSVSVQIPDGVVSVRPEAVPGWEIETVIGELAEPFDNHGETVTEGVREVTWSGGELPDEHFLEFGLSMRLPDTAGETLYFPFVQECPDGEEAWIEIPDTVEQWDELDSPAPFVTLAVSTDAEPVAAAAEDEDGAEDAELASADVEGSSGPDTFSIIALVVGLAGLALGGTALARSRKA